MDDSANTHAEPHDVHRTYTSPNEHVAFRGKDVNTETKNTYDAAADAREMEEVNMEQLDAVNFSKASAANRFAHPRRRHIVTERHAPPTAQSARPGRKRLASPQTMAARRNQFDKVRPGDYRIYSDNTDDSRFRERDREFEVDHKQRDDSKYLTESEFKRRPQVNVVRKAGKPRKESAADSNQTSRIRYSKPEARMRRYRKESFRQSSQLDRAIAESPFSAHLRNTLTISGSAESRSYNAYTDAFQNEARGDGGGLRTIVELLRDSDGNAIVIEKAALVIGILSENDAATRDAFGQFAAVQTLIQCLSVRVSSRYDRTLIVKNVVYALANLLRDSPRNLRLFEMFDGPYKMGKAAASERYENKPDVPKFALRALSELKYHSHATDSQNNHMSTNSSTARRTIMYVLRAMSLHEYRAEIQEQGLDALRTLLRHCGQGFMDSRLLEQCVSAVATAFKLHRESAEVSWQCLTILCDINKLQTESSAIELDVECLFGSLAKVMKEARKLKERKGTEYESLVDLLRRGLDMIESVGCRRGNFVEQAVEAKAVETILEALKFFGGEREELDRIQSILRNFLDCDEGEFRMTSVRAACAILEGIETGNRSGAAVLS